MFDRTISFAPEDLAASSLNLTGSIPEAVSPAIERIVLSQFRNLANQTLNTHSAHFVLLVGANGAGKTNILEAISLLAPGRGLRRAQLEEPLAHNCPPTTKPEGWAVAVKWKGPYGQVDMGIGWRHGQKTQQYRLNGAEARNRQDWLDHGQIIWLTPSMDRLFSEPAAARRRFLDRLILGCDAAHAGRVSAYEKAMRERLVLLRGSQAGDSLSNFDRVQKSWLDSLESQMVERGVAIAAARQDMANKLDRLCQNRSGVFPKAEVAVSCWLGERLQARSALAVEGEFAEALKFRRALDAKEDSTSLGPHRSDLIVTHQGNGQKAAQCSTGEQKALLISLTLAAMNLQQQQFGTTPLLLLDEAVAHLDPERRVALWEELTNLPSQIWLSGVEEEQFRQLPTDVLSFAVERGQAKSITLAR